MHRNPGQRDPTVAQPRRAIKNEIARAANEAGWGGKGSRLPAPDSAYLHL